ncbi:recombinase family protein [Vibrio agarivorans]|uniref:Recombinase family protein n=1 Tax=Vibrio agarivorans TaxID=153622 RepID=A0ABT7Y6V1_9VIBR|nr:recombinase family protein [Vibrio agarivorans]MDN2483773.1 recombinase family protein [Vibrio agarivorans]
MIINPKIYNYARVSTTKQLKGVGLETQQQRSVLEELAHKFDLPIHDENFVDEGLSAYHGRHKDGTLGRVLSLIESGKISSGSILVVFSLDRLSRETVNIAMEQLLSIINRGVRVYTHIDEKMFDAASSNLTADLIVSLITMERANEESATKSKRIIAAQKQALKGWKNDGKPRGALGRVPLWIDQPTNSFNEHAEGIKAAVELFLEGRSTIKVKQHLDENYPFKRTRKTSIKKAQTWDYGVIDQLWRKTSLIGEKRLTIEGQEHVLSNYYPPLISLEKFNKLTRLKQPKLGRSTSTGSIHLLKGLARCGICGSAMVFVDKAQHSKNYVCSLAVKGEPLHNREVFSAELLELLTLEVCRDQYLISSSNAQLETEEKAKAEYELAEEKKQLEELKSRFKQKSRASLLDLIENTEDKIEALEQQLASFATFDIAESIHLLNKDIFTEDVRSNFQHSARAEIIDNLKSVLADVTLNRKVEVSEFTKTGMVNCVSITWRFKNDQTRTISVKPFRYIGTGSSKKLFVPVRYEYTVPVIDEENRRGEKFVPEMIQKLHERKLLNKFYPSKGRYQWDDIELLLGEFKTGLHNFLPNFVPERDAFWGDMVDKATAKGTRYTVLSRNVI